MEKASSEFPVVPLGMSGEAAIPAAVPAFSIPTPLLVVLLVEAAAFALASASGKIPEVAVTLFRALLTF